MLKTDHPSAHRLQASELGEAKVVIEERRTHTGTNSSFPVLHEKRDAEDALFRRIAWRIMPLLFVSYFFAFLDRMNVGYAQLQMKTMLGFSDSVYGFGAGVFFLSYILFQIPSNIWMQRVGARITIARIMVLWGLTSASTMFVRTPHQFYIARFVLGMFEAGFFPAVILYLSYWFPSERRASMTACFMLAIPVAGLIGGPSSGWIMSTVHLSHRLAGWQWLLFLEGLPASILGVLCFFSLTDKPEKATWLSQSERSTVTRMLLPAGVIAPDNARASKLPHGMPKKLRLLSGRAIWVLAFVYFAAACGNYTYSFWLPTILRMAGARSINEVGWLSAIPYVFGIAGAVILARSSDILKERRWHVAASLFLAALALGATIVSLASLTITIVLLSIGAFFLFGGGILFWSMPPSYLNTEDAPSGIALVSSIGVIGGFMSPALLGWTKSHTGGLDLGIICICLVMIGAAAAIIRGLPPQHDRVWHHG